MDHYGLYTGPVATSASGAHLLPNSLVIIMEQGDYVLVETLGEDPHSYFVEYQHIHPINSFRGISIIFDENTVLDNGESTAVIQERVFFPNTRVVLFPGDRLKLYMVFPGSYAALAMTEDGYAVILKEDEYQVEGELYLKEGSLVKSLVCKATNTGVVLLREGDIVIVKVIFEDGLLITNPELNVDLYLEDDEWEFLPDPEDLDPEGALMDATITAVQDLYDMVFSEVDGVRKLRLDDPLFSTVRKNKSDECLSVIACEETGVISITPMREMK